MKSKERNITVVELCSNAKAQYKNRENQSGIKSNASKERKHYSNYLEEEEEEEEQQQQQQQQSIESICEY